LVLCDLASTSPMAPGELMALRALHGMLGGLCVGIVYSVMGRMPAPDRAFGVLLVLQYGLGGLGVMMLPRLVPRFGTPVLFLTMAALAGCALISLLALKDGPPSLSTSAPARAAMRPGNGTPRVIGILLGLFFFQAGNMAIGAFLVGLGTHAGLDRLLVTQALGWSTWIGILGAAAVALLGTGQRRFVLLLGAFLFSILSNGAFAWSRWPGVYFGANVLSSVSWSFVVPVLFGMAAESNTSGRMATVAGLASKLGLATGPLVGGFVLGFGYPALIGLSLGALGVAALSALLAARSCRVASSHDDDLSGQSGSWKD
jgi:DHA1 family inner membrane transport protein